MLKQINLSKVSKKLLKENPTEAHRIANEIVKNTYRTLMTRGQKVVVISTVQIKDCRIILN